MSKTAFYFKTVDEFDRVFFFVNEINQAAKETYMIRGPVIQTESKYCSKPNADVNPTSVPKRTPTKKRYIGVLIGNKHKMNRAGIDPVKILGELKIERVQHSDNVPKYTGKTSEKTTHIQTHKQFKILVSVFNKRFGDGNWKIRGPKKLQKKLHAISDNSSWASQTVKSQYPNGIGVTLVVNEPNVDLKKYIFKVLLMT